MAITAAITLSSATTTTPEQVVATCTVSNSGGDAVMVTDFLPRAYVSASTFRPFIQTDWTGAPGGDFGPATVSAIGDGSRGNSSISLDGTVTEVPLDGLVVVVSPAITLTVAPSWFASESATISATGGDLTTTNAGQPQFPSVSVVLGEGNTLDGTLSVPAGGTLAIKFNVLPFAPAANGVAQAYDIGATVNTTGGVTTIATVATLTGSPQDI